MDTGFGVPGDGINGIMVALRFAEAPAEGQPDGGRIALTLFRDKLDELF